MSYVADKNLNKYKSKQIGLHICLKQFYTSSDSNNLVVFKLCQIMRRKKEQYQHINSATFSNFQNIH